MDKIVEKINNYHIFNYLVPGYLFMIFNNQIVSNTLILNNFIYSFFVAYFIGIVISRISSLIVEKILLKICKIKKEPYDKYIHASKNDPKIEVLTQDCNMYRSMCTLMMIEFILKFLKMIKILNFINKDIINLTFLFVLSVVFALSFAKQCKYISSRIKTNTEKNHTKKIL